MASPVGEVSDLFQLFHFGTGYAGSSGISRTRELVFIPGEILVRVGLSRVGAAEATIGIAEFTPTDGRGTRSLGDFPDWPPQIGIVRMAHVTIGGHVAKGVMKGWFYIQRWA